MTTNLTRVSLGLAAALLVGATVAVTAGCGSSSGGAPAADPFVFSTSPASAYTRVDRMGMPVVNTALITNKDQYNSLDPADDVTGTFVGEMTASIAGLHAALDDDLTMMRLTPCTAPGDGTGTCWAQEAPLILPDVICINTGAAAGFPNGRLLSDQVVDITLAVLLLDSNTHAADLFASIPLNPAANDLPFGSTFPYLAPAH
jgi:hypothetical protein